MIMVKSFLQPGWSKGSTANRFQQLERFYKGKEILDIGCAVGYKKPNWMHENLKRVSHSIFGIDLNKESMDEIARMGYAVAYGDAQDFSISRKFNLIHAGELIEHLDNPGGFLQSVRRHLTDDGMLVITTPNGLRISNFLYAATGGLLVNSQHTCWYCEYTLRFLLQRMGFEIVEIGYLKHQSFSFFRNLMLSLRVFFLPRRVAWNTVYAVARLRKA